MIDPVPWLVSQPGVHHSAEVARSLAYSATNGAEGVARVGDLKVYAQTTPTGSVKVNPGVGIMLNRYAGGSGQTYIGRNATTTNVSISPTSSSGARNDLLIMRVSDTGYAGTPGSDVNAYDYTRLSVIQGVSSSVKTAEELNLGYPAIALALIKVPVSTSAITSAMITDLRETANPRSKDVWLPLPMIAASAETLTSSTGEYFPNSEASYIDIPDWSTRMLVEVEWLHVRYGAGNAFGQCWLQFGPYSGPSKRQYETQKFQFDTPAATNVSRASWKVVDDVYIPGSIRGTRQLFVPTANRLGGVANSVSLDGVSGMSIKVKFLEKASDW